MTQPQILICGAGPVGLVFALWLERFQVPFRIIDKASGPGLASRATIIQSRTLEHYRSLGIVDRVLEACHSFMNIRISMNGKIKGRISIRDGGSKLSPYPDSYILPQDLHETILSDLLTERGVKIQRSTELISLFQSKTGVEVKLRNLNTQHEETSDFAYLIGCDGAHSSVRKLSGIRMEGGTYGKKFYVADVCVDRDETPMSLPIGWANINLSSSDYCMMLPYETRGDVRLVGYVPQDLKDKTDLTFEDIQETVSQVTKLKFKDAAWFSIYNLHHRVASSFRADRIFLCGDACHLHSPIGGQGMNAGIGDATNLAWKLAAILKQSAPDALLQTYEPERRAFAQAIVSTTDTVYNYVSGTTLLGWLFRAVFLSYIVPFMSRFAKVRKNMFMTMSQTKLAYPQSLLSCNALSKKGKISAGDRLPWVEEADKLSDNFDSLTAALWQVHVYGSLDDQLDEMLREHKILTTVFPWSTGACEAGLTQRTLYLLRPDGYIGWTGEQDQQKALKAYLKEWGLGKI